MNRRVAFCGVIEGSVSLRHGEEPADAIARANATINDLLARHARLLSRIESPGEGPIVGLESDDRLEVTA